MTDTGTPLTPEEEADLRASFEEGMRQYRAGGTATAVVAREDIARLLATLDRERRERVDPDLRAALYDLSVVGWNLARITPEGDRIEPLPEVWHRLDEALEQARAILDATPDATPDHTVVGEEREAGEGEQRAALAEAIHRVKPEIVNGATVTGSRVFAVLRGNGWRLTRATPRPR